MNEDVAGDELHDAADGGLDAVDGIDADDEDEIDALHLFELIDER